ncbi:nuclear transport factor 2 family protein [Tenggerimyces flavus]|uniref:Nuclear transport factor 2 family protein n=1 Tax=Tenggerimyces flavus TaxID=1708749 RepID=A0ABV7Y9Y0_9ACTN|nr:nuclear transport factor 2 family protein [Tenggerimyces flavus]MBM7788981.1 ketosteroid isomerase-like protein [Tenggerimyces flavus]
MTTELTRKVFAAVDALDSDALLALLAPNAVQVFGNQEPLIGHAEIGAANKAFTTMVAGVRHQITREWYQGNDAIVETNVTYHRLDGGFVNLPVVSIYRTDENGLIEDYRVFYDPSPVFAPANEQA